MNMLFKMAWFNIWRNRRRTFLLLCAMSVGLAGVLFFLGLMNGWMDQMLYQSVRTFEGHLKIMQTDYHDHPVVEHALSRMPTAEAWLERDERVAAWAPRVVLSMLLSTPTHSRVLNVVGIDPEREARVSSVSEGLRQGEFLAASQPNRILIGRRLATKLKLKLGRKVVLMAQQRGGDLGSAAFRVAGIFETGQGGFDETTVYILKDDAQTLLNLDDWITEYVAVLHDVTAAEGTAADLGRVVGEAPVKVWTWKGLLPIVVQYQELASRMMLPYYALFYLAMAFGIINAVAMAVGERTHEIGVMIAVGMRRIHIVLLILLEVLYTALMAAAAGVFLGGASVWWLGRTGIDLTAFADAMAYFGLSKMVYPYLLLPGTLLAVSSMFFTALLFSLIPAMRAARLAPVTALRQIG